MTKFKAIRNTKISTKLMLLGIVSILGLFLLGRESVFTAWQIDQVSKEMSEVWMNAVIVAEELNTATSDYRILEGQHAITTDQRLMDDLGEQMDQLKEQIDEKFLAYQKLPTSSASQESIRQAQALWRKYLESSEILIETSRGNDREKATELLMGESQTLFNESSAFFLEAVNLTKDKALHERDRASELYQKLSNMKLLVIASVSIIVICLILSLIRSIREPSERLADAARRATNGNLDIHLDYQSEDEIGILTDAMNQLIQRLRDIIQDETRMFQEIGSKNFNVKSNCEQAYRGDFAPLLYAFTSLQSRLKEVKSQQEEEVARLRSQVTELQSKIEELEKAGTQNRIEQQGGEETDEQADKQKKAEEHEQN